jgi:hypothetical protein
VVIRRGVASLTLGIVTALLLSACDRQPDTARKDGGGAGATGGDRSITVVIAEYSKDHTGPFWQALSEHYTKQSGVKVDLRVIDWNSIDQQVTTMIQNNRAPDVLNLNSFSSYARDGLLYTADEVLSPTTRADFLEPFIRGGEYQGKLYGFPILSSARAFFYNRTCSRRRASPVHPGPGTSSRRPRGRSRRSGAAPSATPCPSAPRRPRPSGPSGCGTTAATGSPATPGRSTATGTSRRSGSSPSWPTATRSPR